MGELILVRELDSLYKTGLCKRVNFKSTKKPTNLYAASVLETRLNCICGDVLPCALEKNCVRIRGQACPDRKPGIFAISESATAFAGKVFG